MNTDLDQYQDYGIKKGINMNTIHALDLMIKDTSHT